MRFHLHESAPDELTKPLTGAALTALAAPYNGGGDLRDMLDIAVAAVLHAFDDGNGRVDAADVFAAVRGARERP